MVTARHNDDDIDPCLLSDDELNEPHSGDGLHDNQEEEDDVTDARSNYLRNLVENQEMPVPGTIKTVDEVRYAEIRVFFILNLFFLKLTSAGHP